MSIVLWDVRVLHFRVTSLPNFINQSYSRNTRRNKEKSNPRTKSSLLRDILMNAQSRSRPDRPLGCSTSNYHTALSAGTRPAHTLSARSVSSICIAEKSPFLSQLQDFRGGVLVPQQSVSRPFFFFASIMFDETFQVLFLLLAHWKCVDLSFDFLQLHGIVRAFNKAFGNSLNLLGKWFQRFSNLLRGWWRSGGGLREVGDRIFFIKVLRIIH